MGDTVASAGPQLLLARHHHFNDIQASLAQHSTQEDQPNAAHYTQYSWIRIKQLTSSRDCHHHLILCGPPVGRSLIKCGNSSVCHHITRVQPPPLGLVFKQWWFRHDNDGVQGDSVAGPLILLTAKQMDDITGEDSHLHVIVIWSKF